MRRWPLWAAVALVLGLAALTVVTLTRDEPPPAAPTLTRLRLPLPTAAAGWHRVDDATAADAERAFQQSVDRQVGDVQVAVAVYERDDGARLRITALVPEPGGTSSGSLRADPDGQLGSFLDGAGLTGRRHLAGAGADADLVCGGLPGSDGFVTACGWADRWSLALVAYDVDGLTTDQAGAMTRDVRERLTR